MPIPLQRRLTIEKLIGRKLVKHMLAQGYNISIDNGGDSFEIANATDYKTIDINMRLTDEEHLYFATPASGRVGWVYLVYGNDGYDVISDYTTNLEAVLAVVNEYAAKFEKEAY